METSTAGDLDVANTITIEENILTGRVLTFIVGIGCCAIALLLFLLYYSRKLCFKNIDKDQHVDKPGKTDQDRNKFDEETPILIETYHSYEESCSKGKVCSDLDRKTYLKDLRKLLEAEKKIEEDQTFQAEIVGQCDDLRDRPDFDQVDDAWGQKRASLETSGYDSSSWSPPDSSPRSTPCSSSDGSYRESPTLDSPAQQSPRHASEPVNIPPHDTTTTSSELGPRSTTPLLDSSFSLHMWSPGPLRRTVSEQDVSNVSIHTESVSSGINSLLDENDLEKDFEEELVCRSCQLRVTFERCEEEGRLYVTVEGAVDVPTSERGGADSTQVRMLLLPERKQRHSTKVKSGRNPVFDERFTFKVPSEEGVETGLRLRLYACGARGRQGMIGEVTVQSASLRSGGPETRILTLQPRIDIAPDSTRSSSGISLNSSSSSSSVSRILKHGGMPELQVGLSYDKNTGRLGVDVIRGCSFGDKGMNRMPDTYVVLALLTEEGEQLGRCKTSLRRGQPNPMFDSKFMFRLSWYQVAMVTLIVSVYNKWPMRKSDMIGWISIGLNSSGGDELAHWTEMINSAGRQVNQWHLLLES